MRQLTAACSAGLLLAGCTTTLRSNPTVETLKVSDTSASTSAARFVRPQTPLECDDALQVRTNFPEAVRLGRSKRAELIEAQALEQAAIGRSEFSRQAEATPEGRYARQAANDTVIAAQGQVARLTDEAAEAANYANRLSSVAEKAAICTALETTALKSQTFARLAYAESESEVIASGTRLVSAFAGATFLALNPGNTDNIAAAALLGGAAEAWRGGLKPGERSAVLEKAALANACVVEAGSRLVSFRPTTAEMNGHLYDTQDVLERGADRLETAKAQSLFVEDAARGTAIRRLEVALAALSTAQADLAGAIQAREEAPQHIYEASRLIGVNAQTQLRGLAPNIGAVVDLINKVPEGLTANRPPVTDAPTTPPDAGGRAADDLPTDQINRQAAEVESAASKARFLLRNGDQAAFKAVGKCAAT